MEELMAEEEELMASVELADVDMKVVAAKEVAEGRGTIGGERSTVIPSSGGRGSGGGEAYGGGGVYSGIVMEVVVVKEVVWWYKRKIPQWWLRR
ncbi:BnaC09g11400D [Brassica napus]|uniref:BnaC09g11400D protein n=2 Tax=Brassica napus TaxID=3708 RepID=A0A078GGF6_BRANA|nr:BnaC09g11400D [Brassica napus]